MRFRVLSEIDREAWERLAAAAPMGSVVHDWGWQEVHRFHGWSPVPIGVEEDGRLLAGATLAYCRLPLIGWPTADLHRTLLGTDPEAIRLLLAGALAHAEGRGALRLRVGVRYAADALRTRLGSPLRDLLPRPPDRLVATEDHGTYWIDLSAGEPAWGPAAWNENNRRNLRAAERRGAQIVERRDAEGLVLFYRLYRATLKEDGVRPKPRRFFPLLQPLVERGRLRVLFVHHRGEAIAAATLGLGRVARFLWGGRRDGGHDLPPTGSMLQLAMMRLAAAAGAEFYDLGGAPGPEPVPRHPNFGVWRFKHGFHGRHVLFDGDYDLILSPGRERVLDRLVRLARRAVRHPPPRRLPAREGP